MISCTFENDSKNSLRHVTVGCLVIRDDQVLLGKRAEGLSEANKWCLLGGYVERDETTKEASMREVAEESGWMVDDLRLLRVNDNPNRPHEDRQNIDFIYIAHAIRQTGTPDAETQEICWFKLDALPPADQIAFDHLDSIELYKQYCQAALALPVIG